MLFAVMLLVSAAVFFLLRLAPGDPIYTLLSLQDIGSLSDQQMAELHHRYGLDQPIFIQYLRWLASVVGGNLGWSIHMHQPVAEAIGQRLPVTAELAALALVIAVCAGIPLGIVAAVRRGTIVDVVATALAVGGVSAPNFWLALLLIFLLAFMFPVLPPSGYKPPGEDLLANLRLMILPALTLGAGMMADVMRMMRSSLLEVLGRDYIRTATAKGLSYDQVLVRHALKNALIPVVTVLGLQAGRVLGGAFLIEQIFAIPGLGKLAVDAIFNRDFAVVQGAVLVSSLVYVVVNLLVDVVYSYLDPRIRLS